MKRLGGSLAVLLGLATLVAGCGIKQEVYNRDMTRLRAQINDLEDQKQRLIGEKKQQLSEIDQLKLQAGQLSSEQERLIRKLEELKAQEQQRREMFERLRNSLKDMISAGKLTVVQKRGMMIVQLAEAILFDSGKSRLKTEGEDAIRELTGILAGIPNRSFQVAGHTDNVGSSQLNWRLSVDRALTVVLFMEENGMPPERISAAGFGMFQPDTANDTPENRSLNRRIEIILVPNLDELQVPQS